MLGNSLPLEPVAAVVASGSHEPQQAEVREIPGPRWLGADHALECGEPDLSITDADPPHRRLQRQPVGRIGRDLTGAQGGDDLVLAERPEHGMRADRRER